MGRPDTGRGSIAPGAGWSVFFRDPTAELSARKEWLFFQTWGLDREAVANYVQPQPDLHACRCGDYDARWRWTTILFPEWIGRGLSCPLTWEQIEEVKKELMDGIHQLPAIQGV